MSELKFEEFSLENEEWREMAGYEGLYWVSNLGRVCAIPRKGTQGGLMKGYVDRKGYIILTLRKDGTQLSRRLHRMVAETFIPNPDNLPEVNHKDENKLNNNVENLEWCTTLYNHEYGTRTLRCGRPIRCVETGKEYPGAKWAAKELNLDPSTITRCCRKANHTHGGYHWEYVEDDK